MNKKEEIQNSEVGETSEIDEINQDALAALDNLPAHIKELMNRDRTDEEEKILEEAMFGKPTLKPGDDFRWFLFLSLSQTLNNSVVKEWVGETATNEIVIVNYNVKKSLINIGCGYSEMKAKLNMVNLGSSSKPNPNLTIKKINEELKMEWVLPEGFIEE